MVITPRSITPCSVPAVVVGSVCGPTCHNTTGSAQKDSSKAGTGEILRPLYVLARSTRPRYVHSRSTAPYKRCGFGKPTCSSRGPKRAGCIEIAVCTNPAKRLSAAAAAAAAA